MSKESAQQQTAKERAYNKIRDAILAGQFKPGEQLKEEQLCDFCDVSRTPVRQALRRLAEEGTVTTRENRRSYVTDLTRSELEEAFDVACFLESYSAGLAAERATAEQIAELEALADKMEKINFSSPSDYRQFLEFNGQFHQVIHSISGNRHIAELIRRIPDAANTVFLKTSNLKDIAHTNTEHRELISAIASGDSEFAKLKMTMHIESVRRSMRSLLSE